MNADAIMITFVLLLISVALAFQQGYFREGRGELTAPCIREATMTYVATAHANSWRQKALSTAQVVAAIVERSGLIKLPDGSHTPLILVRDVNGRYKLTDRLFASDRSLSGRHYVRREDGGEVSRSHVVTPDEATAAVRALLGLDE